MSSIFILATDKLTSVLSKLVIIQQKIDLPLNPFDKITYKNKLRFKLGIIMGIIMENIIRISSIKIQGSIFYYGSKFL